VPQKFKNATVSRAECISEDNASLHSISFNKYLIYSCQLKPFKTASHLRRQAQNLVPMHKLMWLRSITVWQRHSLQADIQLAVHVY
jgi:hypothetical protein